MPDTGAPWEIPYLDGTELVRGYPAFSEDLAEQVADGLDAAGGLVAVKHAIRTTPFVSGSVAARGNVAVPDLEIVHEVADENNRLIITAYFGVAAFRSDRDSVPGMAVAEDGTLLGVGTDVENRTAVGAGGVRSSGVRNAQDVATVGGSLSLTFVHTPGLGQKTYTVRVINVRSSSETLFVNRTQLDVDDSNLSRAASALVIQEVKV